MTLNQGTNNKTESWSRKRILFVFLIVCTLAFVFAVQLEWVPDFEFHSPSSTKPSNNVLHDDTPHKIPSNIPTSLQPSKSDSTADTDNNNSQQENETVKPADEIQLNGNKEHDPFITMFPPRPPGEDEKFLAYLPHSGFHNQLISLENALQLAVYLNRTLLLPPLYLSHKLQYIVWKEPSILFRQWSDRNRTNVEYCRDIDPTTWPPKTRKEREAMTEEEKKIDRECSFYHSWTITPWTYFFNLPKLLKGVVGVAGQTEPIRVFSRPEISLAWLEEHLNLKDPSKDIYLVNDPSRYSYRIVDDSEKDYGINPGTETDDDRALTEGLTSQQIAYLSRYDSELLLTDLQQRPEKVLHFGSLFASDRVEALSENHKALKVYIADAMDLWNQVIMDATDLAEKQIARWAKQSGRAAPGFLGLHFRTEDGDFQKMAPRNLRRIESWLQEMIKQDRKYLDRTEESDTNTTPMSPESPTTEETPAQTQPGPDVNDEKVVPTFLEHCMGSPPESPMIFMATDVHHPRESPLLQEYLERFPCTMFLSDFTEPVVLLNQIHNPVDGVRMLPYMVALMDANMASKGRDFLGTDKSTFTSYIMNHLWPKYHPGRTLEIPLNILVP
ncbi:hypothetical protein BGZ49_004222 [Haplosporangium sp. Z 27]|nr:hypothetical protein BGZ49_004222 [Haplosporangium sp. Z 27]